VLRALVRHRLADQVGQVEPARCNGHRLVAGARRPHLETCRGKDVAEQRLELGQVLGDVGQRRAHRLGVELGRQVERDAMRASGVRSSCDRLAMSSRSASRRARDAFRHVVERARDLADLVGAHDAGTRRHVTGAESFGGARDVLQRADQRAPGKYPTTLNQVLMMIRSMTTPPKAARKLALITASRVGCRRA